MTTPVVLDIRADIAAAVAVMTEAEQKHLPFVIARTLTKTAQSGQQAVREEMRANLVLRRKFLEQTVRLAPATKTQFLARVYLPETYGGRNLDFVARQVLGGTKMPRSRHIAVPQYGNIRQVKIRKAAAGPRAVLQQGAFIMQSRSGGMAIVRRKGRERLPLQVLFHLDPRTIVPQRLTFAPPALTAMQRELHGHFAAAWAKAMEG